MEELQERLAATEAELQTAKEQLQHYEGVKVASFIMSSLTSGTCSCVIDNRVGILPRDQLPLNQLHQINLARDQLNFFLHLSIVLHNTVRYIDTLVVK